MSLVAGTNSYISVADADDYSSARLHSDNWTGATTANKEAALIQATQLLDALFDWYGDLADDDQSLGWPRQYVYDCEQRLIDSSSIPQPIKDATCEEAIHLLSGDQLSNPSVLSQGFKRAKLGSMEIEVADNKAAAAPDKIASTVKILLDCYGEIKSGAVSGGGFNGHSMRG